jgi:branched-chain amino acid transport system substrate-binding protein
VFKAWASWTNANGGINGHPVEVIVLDDQGSPAIGLADAHKLIDGDHVLALTSMGISTMGWAPYAAKTNTPMIGANWNESWGTALAHPNVYEVDATLAAEYAQQFAYAKSLGATKVGGIWSPQSGGQYLPKAWAYLAPLSGLTFVKAVSANETSPSFAAPCLALKSAGVDVLVTPLGDQPYKQIVDQCAIQGFHPIVLGNSAQTNPDWLTDSNFSKAGGSISGFPWFDTSVPAIATFNQVMKQYDPAALTSVPAIAALSWATMQVFGAGAKAANFGSSPTSQELVAGLNSISNNTFGGLTPPLTYTNGGNIQVPRCTYVIYKGTDSAWHVLQNGSSKLFCVDQSVVNRFAAISAGKA